jgi:energy-coupling factor transporter ATP-binding protein EcfA2
MVDATTTAIPSLALDVPLFQLTDVNYHYVNGPRVLNRINLEIAPGDRIALVGQNGSGKTTLIKHLCGLLLPEKGTVCFKGNRLAGEHLDRSRLEIGLLFQDPDDQLFGHTLIDDVAFGPSNQGLAHDRARQAALQALGQVHLADRAYKAPHHLSFGQKKRAALAGLLAMQPAVLLLDEPTTNLDPSQEQVFLDLLLAYNGTLVCISHDLLFLYELCQRTVVMKNGRIAHDYTMNDLVAQRGELRSHGLDFSFRLKPSTDAMGNGPPAPVCQSAAQSETNVSPPMLEVRDYDFWYPDGTRALSGIDLSIAAGERIALVGENGAGKTTLLACMLGLQQGTGTYRFEGQTVTRRLRKHLWRNIGMVFQDCADQLFCPSVSEEIAFGLKQLGASKNEIRQRTEDVLSRVHLEGFDKRVPLHMSGGERKRLALACVLAMSPKLLILDEPTAGLDPQGEELLLSILSDLNVTQLMVSHDMFFVGALTRRTLVMHQGTICQDLPTDAFFKDSRLGNLNGLAYSFRQRCGESILALQHEHEHSHFHRHLHDHLHEHEWVAHDHLHKHYHDHRHRFMHSHSGEEDSNQHVTRRYHDHRHDGEHGAHDHDHSSQDDPSKTAAMGKDSKPENGK